jgi:hypothetical protein
VSRGLRIQAAHAKSCGWRITETASVPKKRDCAVEYGDRSQRVTKTTDPSLSFVSFRIVDLIFILQSQKDNQTIENTENNGNKESKRKESK